MKGIIFRVEIFIGLISGVVSGTGMGGGTILIFLLSYVMQIEQHVAQAANLVFFIPTSIVAIIVNLKNKNIDLKLGMIISIFGILGAIIAIHEIYSIVKQYKKSKNENNK